MRFVDILLVACIIFLGLQLWKAEQAVNGLTARIEWLEITKSTLPGGDHT